MPRQSVIVDPAWSVPALRGQRYSQSLMRGLAILEFFSAERPTIGLAEIADELEMSRSTTHRYATTLVALGYLEQGAGRKYRLGLRVIDLGMEALNGTGLRVQALLHLEQLRGRSSYTVSLAILDDAEILYLARDPSRRRIQRESDLNLHVGSRLPAYCTAMGKILLASLPDDEQCVLIGEMKLRRKGPNTITSKTVLREELQKAFINGYAINDRELTREHHAIAAPIRNESNEVVAAVGMVAPVSLISLDELISGLLPPLISTADAISARLGHRREDER